MHVERDLRPAPLGEREPERPHARKAPTRLAHRGGDPPRELDVVALELEVEGDERRPGGDERRTRRGMGAGGAVVGAQLPAFHPLGQTLRPAGPQGGPLTAVGVGGEVAVQEDGDLEVLADQRGGGEGLGAGGTAMGFVEINDGRHVERAHSRVHAALGTQIDVLQRGCGPAHERRRKVALTPGDREHAAIVVWVAVDVE